MARTKKLPEGLWQRGKVYYARFRANRRIVRQKLSTDFKVACELLIELKARANRADFGLMDNAYSWDTLKAEFLRWAKQAVRNPHDYESDLAMIEKYRKVRTVREIDHSFVMGFREWRLAGGGCSEKRPTVTPRTINRQVGTLINMLNKAVTWERIGENPIRDIKPLRHDQPKKERRALTAEEVTELFRVTPDYLRPVWRMFMVTGLRRRELARLTFDDIDFERKSVTVRADRAKSKKPREIPLDGSMLAEIRALREAAKDRERIPGKTPALDKLQRERFSTEHVFVTQANTPWRGSLLERFYTYAQKASIDDAHAGGLVDIHSLRVTFTTLSLEHGASPKAVQAILGHSTLAMTMGIYARATEQSKRAAVSALPYASAEQPEHIIPMPNAHSARTTTCDESESEEQQRLATVG